MRLRRGDGGGFMASQEDREEQVCLDQQQSFYRYGLKHE